MRFRNNTKAWAVFILFLPLAASFKILIKHPTTTTHCPQPCKCNNTIIYCGGAKLERIPQNIPQNATVLHLELNDIHRIDPKDLSHLFYLEALYLQGNNITSFSHDYLQYLPNLKLLDISHNPLICSCSLKWISHSAPTQIDKLQYKKDFKIGKIRETLPTLKFLNRNKTLCANRVEGSNLNPFDTNIFHGCGNLLRFKRSPGCTVISCHNGGTCVVNNGHGECHCLSPYYGQFCENRSGPPDLDQDESGESDSRDKSGEGWRPDDDDWIPGGNSPVITIQIEVIEVGPSYIAISWDTEIESNERFELVVNKIPEGNAYPLNSPVVNVQLDHGERRYYIRNLQQFTLYEICIHIVSSLRGRQVKKCLRQQTGSADTSSAKAITKVEAFISTNERDLKINNYEHDNNKNKQKPTFVYVALKILAAIFGICAMLIVYLGFMYYQRTHSPHRTPNGSQNEGGNQTASDPQQPTHNEIVLVSGGDELCHDYNNPTYDNINSNVNNAVSLNITTLSGVVQNDKISSGNKDDPLQNVPNAVKPKKLVRFPIKQVLKIPSNEHLNLNEVTDA